ncbi:MAG TPA: VacJ family lipoprotein [Rhizomicrobium sp.]|jgi:phospholipid-binding lipoprotein MlaA|nr:VacJ family lipoprotein [Rhizomicrobium sp.]
MKIAAALLCLLAASFLCGCSTPSPQSLADNDPWEKTNRDVFAFDVWVQHHIARPVGKGYRTVLPEPARDGIHNLVTNLHSPIVLANDVLQGDGGKAVDTLGRLVINTTIGIGGLVDVAGKLGIPGHDNDFGITLGQNGIAEGSYLVLPFVGPLPPRDLLGTGVDAFFDPLSWARFDNKATWLFVRTGLRVLDVADRQQEQFDTIERTSIDFYATTRNLYRQSRNAKIRGEKGAEAAPLPDL